MQKKTSMRPEITTITSSYELKRWYWLKVELAAEARRLGIKCTGAKFTILARLGHFYDTGELKYPGDVSAKKVSKFNWHASELSKYTIITDNYKNTQNVRRFFQAHAGPHFKFNVGLIDWMNENVGKTLGDAGDFWKAQQSETGATKIKPHNQFNQYTRDFLADNPMLGMDDVRECWRLKTMLPSENGRHIYEKSDLELR